MEGRVERVEERWSGEAWLAGDEVGVGGLGRVPCPRDRLAVRGESVGGGGNVVTSKPWSSLF